jgi:hypothetical protein
MTKSLGKRSIYLSQVTFFKNQIRSLPKSDATKRFFAALAERFPEADWLLRKLEFGIWNVGGRHIPVSAEDLNKVAEALEHPLYLSFMRTVASAFYADGTNLDGAFMYIVICAAQDLSFLDENYDEADPFVYDSSYYELSAVYCTATHKSVVDMYQLTRDADFVLRKRHPEIISLGDLDDFVVDGYSLRSFEDMTSYVNEITDQGVLQAADHEGFNESQSLCYALGYYVFSEGSESPVPVCYALVRTDGTLVQMHHVVPQHSMFIRNRVQRGAYRLRQHYELLNRLTQ